MFEDTPGLSLKQVIGKKISEVFLELLTSGSVIKEKIEKVATQGNKIRIEYYHEQSGKWFSLVKNKEYLTVIFHDITGTKKANEQIKILAVTALKYLKFPFARIDYQMIALTMMVCSLILNWYIFTLRPIKSRTTVILFKDENEGPDPSPDY